MSKTAASRSVTNVVLVHGAFVDGSGWRSVYDELKKNGFAVRVAQHPTISLAGDVAVTREILAGLDGPVILVGHSYGGVIVTEAGNDPKVTGLVYVAAFVPDKGESVAALIKDPPPGAPAPPIVPSAGGFLVLDRARFASAFASDLDLATAAFMADAQVPWGLQSLDDAVTAPAWTTKPSWYVVATEDRIIPPDAQRAMARRAGSTVIEMSGSHASYVSQPQVVAEVIVRAASAAAVATP